MKFSIGECDEWNFLTWSARLWTCSKLKVQWSHWKLAWNIWKLKMYELTINVRSLYISLLCKQDSCDYLRNLHRWNPWGKCCTGSSWKIFFLQFLILWLAAAEVEAIKSQNQYCYLIKDFLVIVNIFTLKCIFIMWSSRALRLSAKE